MIFIHESEIGFHGNLKSSTCLVDSRWVLQIADFGLQQLVNKDNSPKPENESYYDGMLFHYYMHLMSEKYLEEFLFTKARFKKNTSVSLYSFKGASHDIELNLVFCLFDCLFWNPELLWTAPELLRSKNTQPQGTQKGDTYSFAIILYEIHGQDGPWGKTKYSSAGVYWLSLSMFDFIYFRQNINLFNMDSERWSFLRRIL